MKKWFSILTVVSFVCMLSFALFMCDDDDDNDNASPFSETPTPEASPTTTPPPEFCVRGPGDFKVWRDVGTSGAFHFEAKGFHPPDPGDWEKLVFFWMFNDPPGYYDYHNDGLIYEVRQLRYYGAYPNRAGKVKGGNFGNYHEPYYSIAWNPNKWYSFDIEWSGNQIMCTIDDNDVRLRLSFNRNLSGKIDAAIGWPWALRQGVSGLCYRNYGLVDE